MTVPLRVLFVCTANICRSPFMEIYARSLAGDRVEFASAGTYGFDQRVMTPQMADELRARGLAVEKFRSRPLTSSILDDAELVLCAERAHRQFILDDHPQHFRKVFTVGQLLTVLEGVDQAVRGRDLVAELAARRPPATDGDDIADPYGRGTAAARAAAAEIAGMLDRIVPRLADHSEEGQRAHG